MNGAHYPGDPVDNVLARLEHVKRAGSGWTARCPTHDDRENSLTIGIGNDGRVLLDCKASCPTLNVITQIGLKWSDLYPRKDKPMNGHSPQRNGHNGAAPKVVDTYKYRDENGVELYRVLRYEPKTFKQQRADGSWNLEGVPRVPYCLPELLKGDPAEPVFIVEGEKDAKRLMRSKVLATTNAGGASKWPEAFNRYLAGRHVVVIPDNDGPGRNHAEMIARSLLGTAASVKIVQLPGVPEKGDVSDYLDAGWTVEDLRALVERAPVYKLPPGQAQRAGGLALTTIDDLLNEPEPEVDWLLEGMLKAGGFSIVSARPKVGKSTLARNLAVCVSQGRGFLNRETSKGPVIYLALEEQRSEIANDFRKLGVRQGDPIIVHTGPMPDDALGSLTEAIIRHRAVLAVIDPLIKFTKVDDVNDYAKVYRALGPIVEAARETGCHILALHHNNKLSAEGQGLTSAAMMGSIAFGGNVDTTIIMHRNNENVRTMFTEQRTGVDMPPTVITMDFDTKRLVVEGELDEVQQAGCMRKICDFLSEQTDWVTEKEIRAAVTGDATKIVQGLRRLVADGQVTRQGIGKPRFPYTYALTSICGLSGFNRNQTNHINEISIGVNIQGNEENRSNESKPDKPLKLVKPDKPHKPESEGGDDDSERTYHDLEF